MMMIARRDPEATRAAILEAAEEIFLEMGFGEASMSQIARHAGVTKSLIHHHFGSKDALWSEVKERRFSGYAESQMRLIESDDPSAELLRRSMETYFHILGANPQLVRILAWVFLEQQAQDACMTMDQELVDQGAEKIRIAQEAGELREDLDPRFILFTMIGIVQHWFQDREHILQHLPPGIDEQQIDEAYLADVIKIFFEGVLPR
jgi:TetR/AcrR family transcriptional regulator